VRVVVGTFQSITPREMARRAGSSNFWHRERAQPARRSTSVTTNEG
jgi:hypothetical protein